MANKHTSPNLPMDAVQVETMLDTKLNSTPYGTTTEADVFTMEEMDDLALDTNNNEPFEIPDIARGTRFTKSCYFDATVASGVKKFVTYNHMLLPSFFSKNEYNSLKNDVCLWDVAAQRQVELVGPDALKLSEMITPRAIASMKDVNHPDGGDCRYAIITDADGMVLNDPVVLKIAEDKYWFSVADSDLLLWAKGMAVALSLDVQITEAAVSPCALQGPKSVPLLKDLFGDWVEDLGYFKSRRIDFDGMPIVLARSGWSPERGYELYLEDESRGNELWERLMEAGRKYNIKPGCPNQIRRIEGGMLSYGADIKACHNALELGLPKRLVTKEKDFIGKKALEKLTEDGGAKRLIVGVQLLCKEPLQADFMRAWKVFSEAGEDIGFITSFCFSPEMGANLGIATVQMEATTSGTKVHVETPCGWQDAVIQKLPFMPRF